MSFPLQSLAPTELRDYRVAEGEGVPFLAYRTDAEALRLEPLGDAARVTVGRGEHNELVLGWDPEVSDTHAQLERVGGDWTVVDDGLSRNGSFVNGDRVAGRRRLADGDVLRLGRTNLLFRSPGQKARTTLVGDLAAVARLSDAQRRVLVALCRPLGPGGTGAPASNKEIAEELHLSVEGVKTHIRALFSKLGIDELPQYRKRTELARRALDLGLVGPRDLQP